MRWGEEGGRRRRLGLHATIRHVTLLFLLFLDFPASFPSWAGTLIKKEGALPVVLVIARLPCLCLYERVRQSTMMLLFCPRCSFSGLARSCLSSVWWWCCNW